MHRTFEDAVVRDSRTGNHTNLGISTVVERIPRNIAQLGGDARLRIEKYEPSRLEKCRSTGQRRYLRTFLSYIEGPDTF